MTLQLAFWLLMFIWLIFGLIWNYRPTMVGTYGPVGSTLLLFMLLVLLGWAVFGAPVHG